MNDLLDEELDVRRELMTVFYGAKPVPMSTASGVVVTAAPHDPMPPSSMFTRGPVAACEAPMCRDYPHMTLYRRLDGRAWCPLALQAEWCFASNGATWVKPPHFREVKRAPQATHRMCIGGPLNGHEVRYRWRRAGVAEGKAKKAKDFFGEVCAVHHVFAQRLPSYGVIGTVSPQPDLTLLGVYVLRSEAFIYSPEALDGTYRAGVEAPSVSDVAGTREPVRERRTRFVGRR